MARTDKGVTSMWFFSDEHRLMAETVGDFAKKELAPQIEKLDHEEGFNRQAFHKLGSLGLLGITVSEEDGGAGGDAVGATIAMEEMSAVDASTTLSHGDVGTRCGIRCAWDENSGGASGGLLYFKRHQILDHQWAGW
jgi:alkylation response protein AidB-like acyl-CoA dehydrogenase